MNADETGQKQLTHNAHDENPFLSPDASKILFMSKRDGNYEIYTMNSDGTNQTRLTSTPYHEIFPVWSPDGKQIAYAKKELIDGVIQGGIHIMNAEGSDDNEITGTMTRNENPFLVS